jgi:hypothetical protein
MENNLENEESTDTYRFVPSFQNKMNTNQEKYHRQSQNQNQNIRDIKQLQHKEFKEVPSVNAKFTLESLGAGGTFRVTAEVEATGVKYAGKITVPNNGLVSLDDFEKRFSSMARLQLNNDESAHLHYVVGQAKLWSKQDSACRPLFALVRLYSGRKGVTLLETSGCRQMGGNELFVTLAQRKPRTFLIQQLGGRPGSAIVSVIQTGPDTNGLHSDSKESCGAEEVHTCVASDVGSKTPQMVELQPYQRFRLTHSGSGPHSVVLIAAIPLTDN